MPKLQKVAKFPVEAAFDYVLNLYNLEFLQKNACKKLHKNLLLQYFANFKKYHIFSFYNIENAAIFLKPLPQQFYFFPC